MNRKVKLLDFLKMFMLGAVLLLGMTVKDASASSGILNFMNKNPQGNIVNFIRNDLEYKKTNVQLVSPGPKELARIAKEIDEQNKAACNKKIIDDSHRSCDFIKDKTFIEDEENSDLYKLTSIISLTTGAAVVKGSKEYCEKCYREAFSTMENSKRFDYDVEENKLRKKMQYEKMKNVIDPIITKSTTLAAYYDQNKDAIDFAILEEVEDTRKKLVNGKLAFKKGSEQEQDYINMYKEEVTCKPFESIFSYIDQVYLELKGIKSKDDKTLKKFSCIENARNNTLILSKDLLGADSGFKTRTGANDAFAVGAKYNTLLSEFNKERLLKQKVDFDDKEIEIKNYISDIQTKLANNFEKVQLLCNTHTVTGDKYEDLNFYKKQRIKREEFYTSMIKTLYVDSRDGEKELDEKTKNARLEIIRLSAIDPDISPFINSMGFLCEFIKDVSPEEMKNMDFYKVVKAADKNDKFSPYKRILSMTSEMCGQIEFDIVDRLCDGDDYSLPIDEDKLSAPEKLVLRSKQCVDGGTEVAPARMNNNAYLTSKVYEEFENHNNVKQGAGESKYPPESQNGLNGVGENKEENSMSKFLGNLKDKSENNSNNSRSNLITNSDGKDRNSIIDTDDLFSNDTNDLVDAVVTNSDTKTSSDFVESNNLNQASESRIETVPKVDAPEDVLVTDDTENDFDKMMQDLVGDSTQNTFNQAYDPTKVVSSFDTIVDTINKRDLTQDEIMKATSIGELGDKFAHVKDQLVKGQDESLANDALMEALKNGENIDPSLIPASADKDKLLAEIAGLRAQMDALTKKNEIEEIKEKAEEVGNKEKEVLNTEIKRLTNIITKAGLSPQRDIASINKNNSPQSIFGNNPLSNGGTNYQVKQYNETDGQRIMANPPPTYVGRKKELTLTSTNGVESNAIQLSLSQDRLMVSDSNGTRKAPIQIENIVLDENTGEIKRIVVFGDKEIEYSNLVPESKIAVKAYLEKIVETNKKVIAKKIKRIDRTIASVTKRSEQEIETYEKLLLCLDNPAANGCTTK